MAYRKSFLVVVGLIITLLLGLLVINRTHSYDKYGQSFGYGSNVFPGFELDTTIASVPQVRMMGLTSGNAPINDMPHLPPPEAGGDKGGDLIGRRVPTGGRFDSLPYTTSRMLSIMGRA